VVDDVGSDIPSHVEFALPGEIKVVVGNNKDALRPILQVLLELRAQS
jgi:hypothetical protein